MEKVGISLSRGMEASWAVAGGRWTSDATLCWVLLVTCSQSLGGSAADLEVFRSSSQCVLTTNPLWGSELTPHSLETQPQTRVPGVGEWQGLTLDPRPCSLSDLRKKHMVSVMAGAFTTSGWGMAEDDGDTDKDANECVCV